MATSNGDAHDPRNSTLSYSKPVAHSCSFCQVQEIDSGMIDVSDNGSYMYITVRYRATRVTEGAANKCAFFANCLRSLLPTVRSIRSRQVNNTGIALQKNWVYELQFFTHRRGEPKNLHDGTGRWSCVGEVIPEGIIPPESQRYIPIALKNDPSARDVPQRPFLHNYRSTKSTDWAMQCLIDCDKSHSSCEQPRPTYVPPKLLHIENSEGDRPLLIRLCYTASYAHTDKEHFRYATLSYCWGGPQEFRLDATSEENLLCGVALTLLPQTLVDAVKAAFGLGLSWIWIDSLCIRQDDSAGKAVEIAQMHHVYRSSSVTISAARADSCRQGFLHPCSLPQLGRVSYKLPYALSSKELGSVILSSVNDVTPIDRRSWTLQEHLLPRRVLRYTDYGLHWSCGTTAKYEIIDPLYPPYGYKTAIDKICKLARRLQEDPTKDWTFCIDDWMDIVQQYTRRQLTVVADKLLAISAIAEAWDHNSHDKYLAGIWESHLPLGLMWRCKDERLQDPSARYIAPSWSWASIFGGIEWVHCAGAAIDPHIEILNSMVELANDHAPYGDIKSGKLIIRGLLQETTIKDTPSQAAAVDETSPELDISSAYTRLDFYGETLRAKVAGAQIFCFQIQPYEEEEKEGPSGLILASTDLAEFTRIGIFQFLPPWSEDDMREDFGYDYVPDEDEIIRGEAAQLGAFEDIEPRTFHLV